MLIGLTTSINKSHNAERVNRAYIEFIQAVGGIPILLPPLTHTTDIEELFDHLQGVVLTGGGDIEPSRYGDKEIIEQTTDISPTRDIFEIKLTKMAYERDLPFLGICRGIQVMNVALGGSLHQDACSCGLTEKNHFQERPFEREIHGLNIVAGTRLATIYSEKFSCEPSANSRLEHSDESRFGHQKVSVYKRSVNSIHHQCLKNLAPGLDICAWSDDGLIEGIEAPNKTFFIGVQWHPEYLKADEPLFRAFSECARQSTKRL